MQDRTPEAIPHEIRARVAQAEIAAHLKAFRRAEERAATAQRDAQEISAMVEEARWRLAHIEDEAGCTAHPDPVLRG